MLIRVLEPEVMDSEADARDYDAMDHSAVNQAFAREFFTFWPQAHGTVLDVGTGTAQIPIEMCRIHGMIRVVALDAAASMLALAQHNIATAGFSERIQRVQSDARTLPYPDQHFDAVISNSIVHHLADPWPILAEMVRVCRPGGVLFVRDLSRPDTEAELHWRVETYTAGANAHQKALFADSLRAALSVDEMQACVARLGFPRSTVQMTSDRHWTWAVITPSSSDGTAS